MAKVTSQTITDEDLKKLEESTKKWIDSTQGQQELKKAAEESQKQTDESRAARQMDAYRLKRRIVI